MGHPRAHKEAGAHGREEAQLSHKKARRLKALSFLHVKVAPLAPALTAARAFQADPADHCETPFAAFRDIEPFLFRLAAARKMPKARLRLYDPYYCEGSVKRHLGALGFEEVYNENEDFYARVDEGTVPEHDVLVTNPPFSGTHIERILDFCARENRDRPWMLLLPSFIARKKDFPALVGDAQPVFLVPNKKYTFWSPGRNFTTGRAGSSASADGKETAPFECCWYLWLGTGVSVEEVRRWWDKKYKGPSGCSLVLSPQDFPERLIPKRTTKRPNPQTRKRLLKKGVKVAT